MPEPGMRGIAFASQARRLAESGSLTTLKRRLGRSSGPRKTRRSSPSCWPMSSTTRRFAVAVVHRTGTVDGSRSRTRAIRR